MPKRHILEGHILLPFRAKDSEQNSYERGEKEDYQKSRTENVV